VAHFGPESLAHFEPDSVAHFGRNTHPDQTDKLNRPGHLHYTIENKTTNTWKITITQNEFVYHILLYGDGTVEIENQTMAWSQFVDQDLSILQNHPKWFDE